MVFTFDGRALVPLLPVLLYVAVRWFRRPRDP